MTLFFLSRHHLLSILNHLHFGAAFHQKSMANTSSNQNGCDVAQAAQGHAAKQSKTKPGPLEITRKTRYAILAGIWTATFLSVSSESVQPAIASAAL